MYPYNDFCSIICHEGKPRRSGRYPWGSGEDPYQSITRGNLSSREKKRLIAKAKKNQEIRKKTAESERQKEQEPNRKKSLSEMSDEEVRQAIARLELEKKYVELARSIEPKKTESPKPEESFGDKGKKFLKDVLYNSGKQAATAVATDAFKYIGATAINSMIGKNVINTPVKDNQNNQQKKK